MSNRLYNVKLAVKNLDESWEFYKRVLKPL